MSGAKASKKQRKHGRNAIFCKAYKSTSRREKNKLKKLEKHLAVFVDDYVAKHALAACKKIVFGV